ncbi:MAG: alpha/beta fold hydrolase BchO [Pseudomonadota bacterium]
MSDARRQRGDRPRWETDGANWPNRHLSRFTEAGGLTWHVQRSGVGPKLLMLHGTGAATHSWAGLLPLLAEEFDVLALDLPGHGFTGDPGADRLSLNGMSELIDALLTQEQFAPEFAVGHSAGAALLTRMTIDGRIAPAVIASINGAFLPFPGVARAVFPSLARLLFLNPLTPQVFAWRGRQRPSVERLMESTGSKLMPDQIDPYAMLMGKAGHISGALGMMANWDLETLSKDLAQLSCKLVLIAAANDKTVPPADAGTVARLVPNATVHRLAGLGHLAHEEDANRVADVIVTEFSGSAQPSPDAA